MCAVGEERFNGFTVGEDGVAEALHCAVECVLPYEGLVMCIDHGKVPIEMVEGVPNEGACRGGDEFVLVDVEDY